MKNMTRLFIASLLIAILHALPGCASWLPTAHKPDIQQGNLLEADKLAQLKTGMSKKQVYFLLGSPVIQNTFKSDRDDRWEYLYYKTKAGQTFTPQRLTLHFTGFVLTQIDDSAYKKQNKTEEPHE